LKSRIKLIPIGKFIMKSISWVLGLLMQLD
jgi:hypothetical protein